MNRQCCDARFGFDANMLASNCGAKFSGSGVFSHLATTGRMATATAARQIRTG